MSLTLSDHFMYNTVFIEMMDDKENVIGSATGFMFGFCKCEKGCIPCVVTNRHVLSSCTLVHITFPQGKDRQTPNPGKFIAIVANTGAAIYHPDSTIDLAILPIFSAVHFAHKLGEEIFFTLFSKDNIPSEKEWKDLMAIEEVYMAGFPKGFQDKVNHQPIIRRGITATHPAFDFEGRHEFLVDMPCFEGCSGSPVFTYEEGIIADKRNHVLYAGSRIRLFGIQYAIPLNRIQGQLAVIPTAGTAVIPVMPLYLSLGYIIKSTELLVFDELVKTKLNLDTAIDERFIDAPVE